MSRRCCLPRRWVPSARVLYLLLAAWVLLTAAVLYLLAFDAIFPRARTTPAAAAGPAAAAVPGAARYTPPPSRRRKDAPPLADLPLPDPLSPSLQAPSEEELLASLEGKVPGLPLRFWMAYERSFGKIRAYNCAKLPNIYDLHYSNLYWQLLRAAKDTFVLFGAYLDIRDEQMPVVRVLAMINRLHPTSKYCQLWFQNDVEPLVIDAYDYRHIQQVDASYHNESYQPFLFACPFSSDQIADPPVAVSIVENPCDEASNMLKVFFYKPKEKKNFLVCVKGLDFFYLDVSTRLVEWIELLSLLGADKIVFYKLNIHPNISKVLDYYEKKGRVQVVPITLPAEEPNLPILQHFFLSKKIIHKRLNELIPYNDCFYKNLYSYRYITLLDIDEVIMPVMRHDWIELMKDVEEEVMRKDLEKPSYYSVKHVYFLDGSMRSLRQLQAIPAYMHMLRHVHRSKMFSKRDNYAKGFHNPEHVVTLHNHYPLTCLEKCDFYYLKRFHAQLQHYRSNCHEELKTRCLFFLNNTLIDRNIWKMKNKLIGNVREVLEILQFISK